MTRVVLVEEVLRDYARCSRATLNRRIDAGQFPQPIHVGKRVAWTTEALEHWLATRPIGPQQVPVGFERRRT
jgi:predicted DNA-binding transcriptional regulator AlpA